MTAAPNTNVETRRNVEKKEEEKEEVQIGVFSPFVKFLTPFQAEHVDLLFVQAKASSSYFKIC